MNVLKFSTQVIQHWYLFLISGLIFLGLGIYSFYVPLETFLTLSVLFSISFLVSGIFEISFAVSNRKQFDGWVWTLAFGLINFIIGVVLVLNPALSAVSLPYYVGFSILFRSITMTIFSFELKNYGLTEWGYLLAMGILGILFSWILLSNPLFTGFSIVFWVAASLIVSGAYSIYISLKLKNLHKLGNWIPQKIKEQFDHISSELEQLRTKRTSLN